MRIENKKCDQKWSYFYLYNRPQNLHLRNGNEHSRKKENRIIAKKVAITAKLPDKITGAIVQAQRLFGDPDDMLYIITENLNTFRELYNKRLTALPHVLRLNSTLVMKKIVKKELPIEG